MFISECTRLIHLRNNFWNLILSQWLHVRNHDRPSSVPGQRDPVRAHLDSFFHLTDFSIVWMCASSVLSTAKKWRLYNKDTHDSARPATLRSTPWCMCFMAKDIWERERWGLPNIGNAINIRPLQWLKYTTYGQTIRPSLASITFSWAVITCLNPMATGLTP